jgi:hypothetical protein
VQARLIKKKKKRAKAKKAVKRALKKGSLHIF